MPERSEQTRKQIFYWQKMALSVRDGYKMHRVSGQLQKGPDSWKNVPQHCLVQVARTGTLGEWLGLPEDIIADMKMGSILHDFSKIDEVRARGAALAAQSSPLAAIKIEQLESGCLLENAGFNHRVRRLADSVGGYAPQLIEVQRLLDQPILSEDDWAYLTVHYIDDCSDDSKWVKSTEVGENGEPLNMIDYRAKGLKANAKYEKISQEVIEELSLYPHFSGMTNIEAQVMVSHEIEKRLAQRILTKTGQVVDPLTIPELVDQKIRVAIENFNLTTLR